MSRDKMDVVRSSFAAWNQGAVEEFLALYDPDAEWDMTRYSGWPESPVYRGSEGLESFFEDIFAVFAGLEAKAAQLIEVGDDQVLIHAQVSARGKLSGAPVVAQAWWQLCTVRGGKIARVRNFTDRAEAHEAAGLAE